MANKMANVKIFSDTNPNPFETQNFRTQGEARDTIKDNLDLCYANQVFVIVDFTYNEAVFYKVQLKFFLKPIVE